MINILFHFARWIFIVTDILMHMSEAQVSNRDKDRLRSDYLKLNDAIEKHVKK